MVLVSPVSAGTLCIATIQNELSDAREEITDKLFIKK
jgi:hypothetical protein